MSEDNIETKVKELEAKLVSKDSEIQEYIDKIDNLEELIMELEDSFLKESNEEDPSLLKIRLNDLENVNRELKNRLSLSKLENVKLKREMEKVKKDQFHDISLIKVVDKNPDSESEPSFDRQETIEEAETSEIEEYRDLPLKCPICETSRRLSLPIKFFNQSSQIATITIPNGMVCEHKFQVFFDKSLIVQRYQVLDFEFSHLEYHESNMAEDPENITQFAHSPFIQDIVTILRSNVDDREILGTAIFTNKGKVIYASVPPNSLFDIIKEFEVRREKQLPDIDKIFLELKNRQKICSENIEVQNKELILILIFSEKVNFGMGSMLIRDIKKKIENIN
ncbi:MAG: hypothetical protein ACFFA3_01380 [Promethearchaeota archaeon]